MNQREEREGGLKFRKRSRLYKLTISYLVLLGVVMAGPLVFFLGVILLFPLYIFLSFGWRGEDMYSIAADSLTVYVFPLLFTVMCIVGFFMTVESVKRFRRTTDARLRQKIILLVSMYLFLTGLFIIPLIMHLLGWS